MSCCSSTGISREWKCTSADFTTSVCEGDLFHLGAVQLRTTGGHHPVHRPILFKILKTKQTKKLKLHLMFFDLCKTGEKTTTMATEQTQMSLPVPSLNSSLLMQV